MADNVVNHDASVSKRDASVIINALTAGEVPKLGVQHIAVGRNNEIDALDHILDSIIEGQSSMKVWVGDFGSGKSFMLHLIRLMSYNRNFVVSEIMFDPKIRLYSNDGLAKALYRGIVKSISIKTKPNGNALQTLIELWLEQLQAKVAEEKGVDPESLLEESALEIMNEEIKKAVDSFEGVGDQNFAIVLMKYYEGWAKFDEALIDSAMRWLEAGYTDARTAKKELGVTEIINDDNYIGYLMLLAQLFVLAGYSGFVINMDECVNLYQINGPTRQKNYEVILKLYNICAQNKVSNLFINLAGTQKFLFDRTKGLYSYGALKTRLEGNPYAKDGLTDYDQPVFVLEPLSPEAQSVLYERLLCVYNVANDTQIQLTHEDIQVMMNECQAKGKTLPRDIIKVFLSLLNLMRQNPGKSFAEVCGSDIDAAIPKGGDQAEEIEDIEEIQEV
jgi:hypothetical protein